MKQAPEFSPQLQSQLNRSNKIDSIISGFQKSVALLGIGWASCEHMHDHAAETGFSLICTLIVIGAFEIPRFAFVKIPRDIARDVRQANKKAL